LPVNHLKCSICVLFPTYITIRFFVNFSGKVLFGRSNVREVALKRKDGLNDYLQVSKELEWKKKKKYKLIFVEEIAR